MRAELPIRRATKEDRDVVVRTLTRAFDRDPVVNWMLRKDERREWAHATAFDVCFTRLTLPPGESWIAGAGAEGVALWTPPGAWKTARAIPDLLRLGRAVGLTRGLSLLSAVSKVQEHHPTKPHWYLFSIGVDPSAQGRGVGSALLRHVLATCDARGEPAYLEASTRDNARLYARHGFVALAEVTMADGAPPIWPMWREPAATAGAAA